MGISLQSLANDWTSVVVRLLEGASDSGTLCVLLVSEDVRIASHGHLGKLKSSGFLVGDFLHMFMYGIHSGEVPMLVQLSRMHDV